MTEFDAAAQVDYQFTNDWFDATRPIWETLLAELKPSRILEVGSFEGRGACYFIGQAALNPQSEVHCVDTWGGGVEHGGEDMAAVEARFRHNTALALEATPKIVKFTVHKDTSDVALARLLASGKRNYFDLVYIDGSHQAPDVLADAVLGFRLLRVGGLLVFDDYLWQEKLPSGTDVLRCPRIAVDSFATIYARKVRQLGFPLLQAYFQKLAD